MGHLKVDSTARCPQAAVAAHSERSLNLNGMKKSRFTEPQIIKALKEHEAGRNAQEICRELGITTAAFYKWRQRYGGLKVNELKKMKNADFSIPALRLIRVLEHLKEFRGLPEMIRVDNGPEFISHNLDIWCRENQIKLVFIQPGRPMQNAFIERCNGSIRRELLNAYIFKTISEVRAKAEDWMMDYNYQRPHQALNFKTPVQLLEEIVS